MLLVTSSRRRGASGKSDVHPKEGGVTFINLGTPHLTFGYIPKNELRIWEKRSASYEGEVTCINIGYSTPYFLITSRRRRGASGKSDVHPTEGGATFINLGTPYLAFGYILQKSGHIIEK